VESKTRLIFPILLAFLFLLLSIGLLLSYFLQWDEDIEIWVRLIDIPSLLFVFLIGFFQTLTRFSLRDMAAAIKGIGRRPISKQDLFLQDYFWQCVIRNLLVLGVLGCVVGAVQILASVNNPAALAPSIAVMGLTFLYSSVASLLLPIPALFLIRRFSTDRESKTSNNWKTIFYQRIGCVFSVGLILLDAPEKSPLGNLDQTSGLSSAA